MSIVPQSSPVLYVPTLTEIMHAAASAKRRHPQLASRIDKAAELLAAGGLQLDAVAWERCQLPRWKVASQSGRGAYVIVNGHCPCEDSHRHGANCKHAIALHLYMKVLRNRFNADVKARQIDLGILPDKSFTCYARKMGIVSARKLGPVYTFADDASAVRYSIWAATQQPVAVAWPLPAASAAFAIPGFDPSEYVQA